MVPAMIEETFTLTESKLAWYLVMEVMKRDHYLSERPEVGDMVVEITHVMGGARNRLGSPNAVGELIEIREEYPGSYEYHLKLFDGTQQWWSNSRFAVLEKGEKDARTSK